MRRVLCEELECLKDIGDFFFMKGTPRSYLAIYHLRVSYKLQCILAICIEDENGTNTKVHINSYVQ